VGVFFPRRRRAIEPLASPSPNLVHPPPRSPSRALRLRRMSFSRRGDPGRRMRCRPRPPIALPREKPRLVSIQDAFHRQGPFVGSGGLCVPGPATAAALLARRQPLDDDLSPPWACLPYPPRVSSEWARPATLFSPPDHAAVSSADAFSKLGFCSLAPAAFFEARLTSVFETRCRLPISATTYTTCGQPNPGSRDPCRDGGLDLLPVLPCHVDPLARAVTRGKPRYVQ